MIGWMNEIQEWTLKEGFAYHTWHMQIKLEARRGGGRTVDGDLWRAGASLGRGSPLLQFTIINILPSGDTRHQHLQGSLIVVGKWTFNSNMVACTAGREVLCHKRCRTTTFDRFEQCAGRQLQQYTSSDSQ